MKHNQREIETSLCGVQTYCYLNLMIRYLLKEQGVKEEDLPAVSNELKGFCEEFLSLEDFDKEEAEAFKAEYLSMYLSQGLEEEEEER